MGISRDKWAPTGLTNKQKLKFQLKLNQHPDILQLYKKQEQYKQKIKSQRYHPIDTTKGTKLYNHYDKARCKLNSVTNILHKQKEDQVILNFHNAIDDHDIERQLSDSIGTDIPTHSAVQYEFYKCSAIAKLLSQPLNKLKERHVIKLHIKFICNLVKYCN